MDWVSPACPSGCEPSDSDEGSTPPAPGVGDSPPPEPGRAPTRSGVRICGTRVVCFDPWAPPGPLPLSGATVEWAAGALSFDPPPAMSAATTMRAASTATTPANHGHRGRGGLGPCCSAKAARRHPQLREVADRSRPLPPRRQAVRAARALVRGRLGGEHAIAEAQRARALMASAQAVAAGSPSAWSRRGHGPPADPTRRHVRRPSQRLPLRARRRTPAHRPARVPPPEVPRTASASSGNRRAPGLGTCQMARLPGRGVDGDRRRFPGEGVARAVGGI